MNQQSIKTFSRRQFTTHLAAGGTLLALGASSVKRATAADSASGWKPRYVLASSLYGTLPLDKILPEVAKTGAAHIDIWPKVHANQREQVEEMGHDRFEKLLAENKVQLGLVTRYDLGAFKLRDEVKFAQKFGAKLIICHAGGKAGLKPEVQKEAVLDFAKRVKPELEVFAAAGVTLGIENHSGTILESRDGILWLAEALAGQPCGIALAPYHLSQDPELLAKLIDDLGDRLAHFYAWEHGKGATEKLPKAEELTQLPGRGKLDFKPLMAALARTKYARFVEVFMHPVPRGVPILETSEAITAAVNQSRTYLESLT